MPLSIALTSSRLSGLLQSTPATSPAKTGWSGQIDTDMSFDIPQILVLLSMIFRLIEACRNENSIATASVRSQIVGSRASQRWNSFFAVIKASIFPRRICRSCWCQRRRQLG
jgi:hypothetical protein